MFQRSDPAITSRPTRQPLPATATCGVFQVSGQPPDVRRFQAVPDGPGDQNRVAIYEITFWLAYLSNALVSAANTLLCRYADYVDFLGGTEYHLGWIVGVGMVGSLLGRFALGDSIDRFGAKRLWLITILGTTAACLLHLLITDYRGPLIYAARVLYILMLAGVFSASMTLISSRAPKERLAEVIGIFGSAGFAGVILGAPLADLFFPTGITTRVAADTMFILAALICLLSLPLAWLVPENGQRRANQEQTFVAGNGRPNRPRRFKPTTWQILCRYWPGSIVAAGVVAGAALFVPPTFLPRFVAGLGGSSISGFFVLYATTAIVVRSILLRPLQRWGLERVIALGLLILAVSQVLFLFVRQPWQLIIPGLVFGVGHALLFPAIVGLGSAAFPKRHRGLATTLMMATFDAGLFLGGPLAGAVLRFAESVGWPRYPAMFLAVCGGILAFVGVFVMVQRKKMFPQPRRRLQNCQAESVAREAETVRQPLSFSPPGVKAFSEGVACSGNGQRSPAASSVSVLSSREGDESRAAVVRPAVIASREDLPSPMGQLPS